MRSLNSPGDSKRKHKGLKKRKKKGVFRQLLNVERLACNVQRGYTQHNSAEVEWEADWLMLVGYKHRKEEIHWVPSCAAGIDYAERI